MKRATAIELRPGYWISSIIKGHCGSGETSRRLDSAASLADLTAFFDAGITTFDCGDGDPGFERLLGSFRQDLHRAHGSAETQSLRIHTKLASDLANHSPLSQDLVENAVDQSIARLGVDTLDLVQLQWPDHDSAGALDALGYLTLMQAKGKVRHLGITNVDANDLETLMRSGIDLAVAQVPFSLIDHRPKGDFTDLCQKHSIALLAYGTLAGGFISSRWLGAPDPGNDVDSPLLARQRLVIEAFGGWSLFQELLLALSGIATRHGVTLDGVALRAMHDHADIASVVLRTAQSGQLARYLKAFNFTPTIRDREALAAVLAKRHGPDSPVFGIERERTKDQRASAKSETGNVTYIEGVKREARRQDG